MGYRYNLTLKKKMAGDEKSSGINPAELTDIERDIQDVFERSKEVQNEDNHNDDKSTVEEIRRNN